MERSQTYATHRHRPSGWLVTVLAAVAAFCLLVLFALRQPGLVTTALLLLSGALVAVLLMLRRYATRLQDRIIRLEMRLRLAAIGREADLATLAIGQIVALRFASDAELPALLDRTIGERLTPDQIKRAVVDWQPDWLRT